jgi:hypothetical protein
VKRVDILATGLGSVHIEVCIPVPLLSHSLGSNNMARGLQKAQSQQKAKEKEAAKAGGKSVSRDSGKRQSADLVLCSLITFTDQI